MGKIFGFVAVVLASLLVWWFGFRSEGPAPEELEEAPAAAQPSEESADDLEDEGGPELAATASESAAPVEPPAAEPTPLPPNSVELKGRVLDERRRPVASAEIHTVLNYEAPPVAVVRSQADGSFVVRGVVRPQAHGAISLRAIEGDRVGIGGVVSWPGMPDSQDAGIIPLGPGHALELLVRDASGSVVPDAAIAVEVTIQWQRRVLLLARTQADGSCRLDGLPTGAFRILAGKAGHGRCIHPIALPRSGEGVIELTLGAERPLRVVVTDKTTGAPIPEARVRLEEFIPSRGGSPGQVVPYLPSMPQPLTDANGSAVLAGIGPADQLQVHATADGYPGPGNSRAMRAHKIENDEVHVKLAKLRTVRWPLASDDPLAPTPGTPLHLEQAMGAMTAPLPHAARVESGEIIAEGCDPGLFHLIASTPDGTYAQLFVSHDSDTGREPKFQKPRKVLVTVKDHEGNPARDVFVSLRNQGNAVLIDGTPVDAEGRVEFKVRWTHLVDVFVGRTKASYAGASVGSLNLKEKGGSLDATLPAPGRPVELTIYIDGEARLPPVYTFTAGFRAQAHTVLEEDPDAGVVRFRLATADAAAQKVPFSATGFLPTTIEVPAAGADLSVSVKARVDLARGGFCIVRIKPPSDGRHQTRVVSTSASGPFMNLWRPGGGQTVVGEEDGYILARHGPLKPGSYTAVDGSSHKRSAPFEIKEGEETTIEFDLSSVAVLKGQVELPDGFEITKARVEMSGENIHVPTHPGGQRQGAYVNREGAFQVRIPGDQPITLTVAHPMLVPDPDAGSVELTKAVPGVTLKLVEGSSAVFQLDPPVEMPKRGRPGTVQVFLYSGPLDEEPLQRLMPTHKDGVFTIGGFSAGTYTAVVSARYRAPLILEDVALGAKKSDWGTLSTKSGATLRIKVLVKEGQDVPRVFASAHCESGPSYTRYINSRGEAEVLVRGLGKGNFRLRAHPMRGMGSGQKRLDETIKSDGETEIVRELDLR